MTGLLILLPIALTVMIVVYLFDLFTNPIYRSLEYMLLWVEEKQGYSILHHAAFVTFLSRLAALVLTFLLIVSLGYLARVFFFNAILKTTNKVLARIPIIGTIYRLTKDITGAMLSTGEKTFKETVLIPFPTKDMHTMGFVTGDLPQILKSILPDADTTIWVPTAPHPITGFVLFCQKQSLHKIDISLEDTFKFMISCGAVHPQPKQ